MKKQGRFCIAPFVALNTRGDKTLRVCCSIKGMYNGMPRNHTIDDLDNPKLYQDDVYDLSQDSVEDVWNSLFMRDLRKRLLNNEYVPNCSHCHQLEDRGLSSKRLSKNKRYLETSSEIIEYAKDNDGRVANSPKWWEIRLSTNCNLACRMCTPGLSSKMRSEFRSNFHLLPNETEKYVLEEAERRSKSGSLADNPKFLRQIRNSLSDIDVLEMRGGEVLADKKTVSFIEEISLRTEHAKNITFDLSSNITLLNDTHIDIFNRFKGGKLRSSIDAFGIENEYIRYNSSWNDIVESLKLQKHLHSGWSRIIQITIQVYQVYTIDKLLWFIDGLSQDLGVDFYFGASTVRDTPYLLLELAPENLRQEAAKKIRRFYEKSYLCNRSENRHIHQKLTLGIEKAVLGGESVPKDALENFRRYTNSFDNMRGQNCLDLFPHLAPLFDEETNTNIGSNKTASTSFVVNP